MKEIVERLTEWLKKNGFDNDKIRECITYVTGAVKDTDGDGKTDIGDIAGSISSIAGKMFGKDK